MHTEKRTITAAEVSADVSNLVLPMLGTRIFLDVRRRALKHNLNWRGSRWVSSFSPTLAVVYNKMTSTQLTEIEDSLKKLAELLATLNLEQNEVPPPEK